MKVNISTFELSNKAYLGWDACKIAEEVYQRACCDADTMEEAYDNIYQALDDEMIYTSRQWTIMQEYQTPEEANFSDAYDLFLNDLLGYFDECVTLEDPDTDQDPDTLVLA